ncbi:HEPN domain-containing protein [uncultured Acetobacteroides sp.]|uniref:HEPN domain-containing protein n=1 Tax=uncultured Acetobacteroides sp. TaxID=1760811 RepID=UPI0029F4EB66|nr:HEPN domain-containing protein [uncultured Acetobacteroides sp.]
MSFLLQKSEENIKSAEHLIAQGCYTSSIHCSYYACIQRMLNIFYTVKGYDHKTLKGITDKIGGKGLHEKYINLLLCEFSTKKLNKEKADFLIRIETLRQKRNNADYFNKALLTRQESEEVLRKTKEVVTLIKTLE